jgi:predicted CopG family antitoxin
MATKTISIDVEAYRRLKGVQKPNESFSQTIKRVVRKPINARRLIEKVRRLSPDTIDALEEVVATRAVPSRRSAGGVR